MANLHELTIKQNGVGNSVDVEIDGTPMKARNLVLKMGVDEVTTVTMELLCETVNIDIEKVKDITDGK